MSAFHNFVSRTALAMVIAPFGVSSAAIPSRSTASTKPVVRVSHVPLFFEANQGQTAPGVKFLARTPGSTLFLTGSDAVMTLPTTEGPHSPHRRIEFGERVNRQVKRKIVSSVRLHLLGANPHPVAVGEEEQQGKSHYFIGNDPKKWRTNIPNFARVRMKNVYPGVDLVFYGSRGSDGETLEHDFVVSPGAPVSAIRLRVEGATHGLHIDRNGDLRIQTVAGRLMLGQPSIYQEDKGARKQVAGRYQVSGADVQFRVGPYDQHRPLVIDPVIYSTYLGGSNGDLARSIAVDAAGNAYVTGGTASVDFPLTAGALQRSILNTSHTAFVTKLNATGTALLYSTYLGGSGTGGDEGWGITVDTSGDAYVTGDTFSSDFPTTAGVLMDTNSKAAFSRSIGFVTKLNASGSALTYSTLLGGIGSSGDDQPYGIALDSLGDACVAGYSSSVDFPTTANAFQTTSQGQTSAFVSKLSADGSSFIYSTLLGATNGTTAALGITVGPSGNVYVGGETNSPDFPTTAGAYQRSIPGQGYSGFVAEVNATGSNLIYSTFLGGTGSSGDSVETIAVDPAGDASVAGDATSRDFPTTPGAFQRTNNGSHNAFFTRLNSTGSALVTSTLLGGSGSDFAEGVALDPSGDTFITGSAGSSNFPITLGAFQYRTQNRGNSDAFLAEFDPTGSTLLYSTYLGGASDDIGSAAATDGNGSVYIAGFTKSSDFPVTTGAAQTVSRGASSGKSTAFVTRFSFGQSGSAPLHTYIGTGWHLISSPYTIGQTFVNLGIRAYAYNPTSQSYINTPNSPADTFHLGQGYWIYIKPTAGSLTISGPGTAGDQTRPFAITLGQGWNLVGDPFTTAEPLSQIQVVTATGTTAFPTAASSHVVSPLYVYDSAGQSYSMLKSATDLLNPWDGVWVYSRYAGAQLIFNPPGSGRVSGTGTGTNPRFTGCVELTGVGSAGPVAVNNRTNIVYIVDTQKPQIAAFDPLAQTTTLINIGSSAGDHIAVDSSVNKVYVTASSNLVRIDPANGYAVSQVNVGTFTNLAVAVDNSKNLVGVASTAGQDLKVFNGASLSLEYDFPIAGVAPAIAVDDTTHTAYVGVKVAGNGSAGSAYGGVVTVDANGTVSAPIVLSRVNSSQSFTPVDIAVNSGTHQTYVLGADGFNGNNGWVHLLNDTTIPQGTNITATNAPRFMALNPATNKIYVADSADDSVNVLDTNTSAFLKQVMIPGETGWPIIDGPFGVGVNSSTDTIYATMPHYGPNGASCLAIIDGG